jgi:2C-methyl-D-erythritol 2,4-cyclodiphosphate synthase
MDDAPTEAYEHAEHAAHTSDKFVPLVAVTIAVLAVLAAGVGSLETIESGAATAAKTESVLFQNKATDNWNFFEAKSLKKNMYDIAAAQGGPKSEEFRAQAARNEAEGLEVQRTAKSFEARSDDALGQAEMHEQRHHFLTVAVTLLHIAIAIATIAIITGGRRWPWHASLLLGVIGSIIAAAAYAV